MKYGYFDDSSREYVITTPKTPLPWLITLAVRISSLLSPTQVAAIASIRMQSCCRLTRYRYNNVPFDDGGHYFYIKDGDTVWNPGWQPCTD